MTYDRQALAASGVVARLAARDAARRAADRPAVAAALTAAAGPALAAELLRLLRGGTPYSNVPRGTAHAEAELRAARPDIASKMTPDEWTAYFRAYAGNRAAEMSMVKGLQAADHAGVVAALTPVAPVLAEYAAELLGRYRRPGAVPGKPGQPCGACRLVTDPAALPATAGGVVAADTVSPTTPQEPTNGRTADPAPAADPDAPAAAAAPAPEQPAE
jgi:hypothetical protein